MPSENNTLQDNIISRIQKIENAGENKEYKGLYLFCSLDLVNATDFKIKKPEFWPIIFHQFYAIINREMKSKFENIKIWKYAGDEVLLFQKINNDIELYTFLPDIKKISDSIITSLKNLSSNEEMPLATKCTVWIAPVKKMAPQNMDTAKKEQKEDPEYKNIAIEAAYTNSQTLLDFLGPDIDLGFRIAKYSHKEVITVSADFAYLLNNMSTPQGSNQEELFKCLKIVGFKQLKGIWGGRAYPIIWYHEDWNNIVNSFHYDEHCESDLINNAISKKEQDITKLSGIYKQLGIDQEKSKLLSILTHSCQNRPLIKVSDSIPIEKLSEVHCAAVVFNEDGKILVGKRPETKKRLKGLWEFGCGQLKPGISFSECIKTHYKEDFSIDLEVYDKSPVSTYEISIEAENRVIPGIIFIAKVTDKDSIKNFNPIKHTEINWIGEADIEEQRPGDYVPDAINVMRKAFRLFADIDKNPP